ncbi:MAG: hypothetical protein AB1744_02305 [Candidatus Zixiibacteriota bacterium]
MRYLRTKLGVAGTAVALVFLTGCLLLSGTFVAVITVKAVDFNAENGFYYEPVDLSKNDVWEDHKDKIKNIETVGFELWITNNGVADETFKVYLDDFSNDSLTSVAAVEANATIVLDNLNLPANSPTHVTYGQSFGLLKNVDKLKELVGKGRFHYYGLSSAGNVDNYVIDSVRIVITFLAGV